MSRALLEAAFRATTYRVTTPAGVFDLRIGRADPDFDAFVFRQSASRQRPPGGDEQPGSMRTHWGIVTAYNPGVLCSDQENCRAQARLLDRLTASGRVFFATSNLADGGAWPVEASYLVLPCDEEEMRALASEFGQVAVVWGQTGSAPQLLWL